MAVLCTALTNTANVLTEFGDAAPGMVATWLSLTFWAWKLWSAARCLTTTSVTPAPSRAIRRAVAPQVCRFRTLPITLVKLVQAVRSPASSARPESVSR